MQERTAAEARVCATLEVIAGLEDALVRGDLDDEERAACCAEREQAIARLAAEQAALDRLTEITTEIAA